jgi:uncharacterized protein YkwD
MRKFEMSGDFGDWSGSETIMPPSGRAAAPKPTSQMKKMCLTLVVAVVGGMLFSSCASSPETTRVAVSASNPAATAKTPGNLDERLTASLNQYRQSIGKAPLPRHRGLDQMALDHCRFMAANRGKFKLGSDNITHYGFEERTLLAQRAHGMQTVAENVAGGYMQGDLASGVTQAWVKSKGHEFNLRSDWDATGVAILVTEDGMVYATQIFATQNGSTMGTMDRFRQF